MTQPNLVREKAYSLALEILKLYKEMQRSGEYVLSKQILKSGTSVGANIEEAQRAQSRSDFVAKLSIAHKEICETQYWIRLFNDGECVTPEKLESCRKLSNEVMALLTAIIKKTRKNGLK